MPQTQSSPTVCPKCQKTMRLMLVKGTGRRKLRCIDAASRTRCRYRYAGLVQRRTRFKELSPSDWRHLSLGRPKLPVARGAILQPARPLIGLASLALVDVCAGAGKTLARLGASFPPGRVF